MKTKLIIKISSCDVQQLADCVSGHSFANPSASGRRTGQAWAQQLHGVETVTVLGR